MEDKEVLEILMRYADPLEMEGLLRRIKKAHIKDGLPQTFVGISVSMASMVTTLAACEKLVKETAEKPGEMMDVMRSAWGCLVDRLTDLAMDDKNNIGMNIVQWGAFVVLALYFECKGDPVAMKEAADAIVKKNIEIAIMQNKPANLKEGNASPTIN